MSVPRRRARRDGAASDPEAPVETARAVMHEREVRHLPVVDDQRDVLRALASMLPSVKGADPDTYLA
jgi:CBS domain-containing protein